MLPHTSEKWLGTCCDKINPRPVAERLETTHSNFLEAIKPCQGPEEIPKNKPFKTKEELPQQQTLHGQSLVNKPTVLPILHSQQPLVPVPLSEGTQLFL